MKTDQVNVNTKCHCGADECWDLDDCSWMKSGWHGVINGCQSSVFFIHGKKIREQRFIQVGTYGLINISGLLAWWSDGLPNARLIVSGHDDGGTIWIEGEREPNPDDLQRLNECRAKQDLKDLREYERLHRKVGAVVARYAHRLLE